MAEIKVKIFRIDKSIPMPEFKTPGSVGMDIMSRENHILRPGEIKLVAAGFKMEVPIGYEAQVRARSGLALKKGVTVVNGPGTIDSDYRGEVGAILVNHSKEDFEIKKGDRIAQIVFNKIELPKIEEVEEKDLEETFRGEGGFGSTGVK